MRGRRSSATPWTTDPSSEFLTPMPALRSSCRYHSILTWLFHALPGSLLPSFFPPSVATPSSSSFNLTIAASVTQASAASTLLSLALARSSCMRSTLKVVDLPASSFFPSASSAGSSTRLKSSY